MLCVVELVKNLYSERKRKRQKEQKEKIHARSNQEPNENENISLFQSKSEEYNQFVCWILLFSFIFASVYSSSIYLCLWVSRYIARSYILSYTFFFFKNHFLSRIRTIESILFILFIFFIVVVVYFQSYVDLMLILISFSFPIPYIECWDLCFWIVVCMRIKGLFSFSTHTLLFAFIVSVCFECNKQKKESYQHSTAHRFILTMK